MAMKKLNDQQLAFFDTFGFLSLPGLVRDRIDEITAEFEAVWKSRGGAHGGKPHDGKQRSAIVPFIDQSENLCSLLDDPRIEGVAASLLGDDFNYLGSDGNYYAGDTGWHSDGWHPPEQRHIKIALYLDPLTRATGALRVIPGSHVIADRFASSLQKNISKGEQIWGVAGRDVPALALETTPGDVVIFNHNTKHSSFGGSGWRRMFTMNLGQRLGPEQISTLRGYINSHSRFWIDRLYSDVMIRTATPGRMRHLEQVMANDDELSALSRKARETMAEPARG